MDFFIVGERVSILDETGVYTIKEISSAKILIEDEFGFEQWIESNFLVKRRTISINVIQKKDSVELKSIKKDSKSYAIPEIDLHIERLVDSDSQLSSHEKFILQITQFKRFTNQMIERKVTKFRVIHGVGEGKLKSEIRALIYSRKGFIMHDDNIANGKVGASLIEMQVTKVVPF